MKQRLQMAINTENNGCKVLKLGFRNRGVDISERKLVCPYCGKDARLAEQNIETCHNGKHDPGVLGHYFTCECTRVWVDWYRYDETSR